MRDLFGIVWAYWHPTLGKLVVQRSWAKRNAGTAEIAGVIHKVNAELWETSFTCDVHVARGNDGSPCGVPACRRPLRWWDGPEENSNPAMHVSDVDPRLQRDLNVEHGLHVTSADKSRKANGGIGDARLFRLRDWFKHDKILILPNSGPLEAHVDKAKWNDQRTDLARHPKYGHFDCMKALAYLVGRIQRWTNIDPRKPGVLYTGREQDVTFGPNYEPAMSRAQRESAALFGDPNVPKHPAPGVQAKGKAQRSKCPHCGYFKRCEIWDETIGAHACSQECVDKWARRDRGRVPT